MLIGTPSLYLNMNHCKRLWDTDLVNPDTGCFPLKATLCKHRRSVFKVKRTNNVLHFIFTLNVRILLANVCIM